MDYFPENKNSISKEREVLSIIQNIQETFLQRLTKEFGNQRGWRLCGPASITLSRIISAQTGVPIGINLDGEHLELEIGIFDPGVNTRERFAVMEEQTYIRYYNGQGDVYYIDPIYDNLIKGNDYRVIKIEKFTVENIDRELQQQYSLHPFNSNHPDLQKSQSKSFKGLQKFQFDLYYLDNRAIINDDRAFLVKVTADSGAAVSNYDAAKLLSIIKTFAPDWSSSNLEQQSWAYMLAIGEQNTPKVPFSYFQTKDKMVQTSHLLAKLKDSYIDQIPQIEKVGGKNVLTYHVDGIRLVISDDGEMRIFGFGSSIPFTQSLFEKLEKAVRELKDSEIENFLKNHLILWTKPHRLSTHLFYASDN